MTAGEYLKQERTRAKVSQLKLSIALNCTQQLISHWEAGKQAIPNYQVNAICSTLGLFPETLMWMINSDAEAKFHNRHTKCV